ncbi:efflux RND transporter permease subunit [Caloranaerobacter ferrireducens]|uniref:efflux RND transporter permease subunit n=1 Tax=Caloranaerobacter ferrireducens TaxID=1323370 RepID=UPI00084D1C2A|nr:efflux RND transporter permease subunit [Caloranaerobacter ferrireducens]
MNYLSKLAVKRPVTILMITFIVIILGSVSLSRLPIDLLPEIEVPIAIVTTSYEGVGPQEIEKLITKPIEEALATVGNIKNINSISSEGNSMVIAEFNFGTDMDFAALEMREKIDLIKGFLPDEASEPMVFKIDPNAMPIIQLSLSGSEDLTKLQRFAEDTIKQRLERLDGVASVDISGGYENQVEIKVNQNVLKGYGIDIGYIAQIIGSENLNLPGGKVRWGKQELTIRTVGEFNSIDEIKHLPITLPTGGIVHLEDIADVRLTHKELSTVSRTNGKESINISIQKQSGTNTVKVAEIVNSEIEKLKKEFPTIEIDIVIDQSKYIKKSINSVYKNAVVGALLAITVLYIFLRNFGTTLIIGTSIPVSIIATFILLYFSGVTLNMMTLGGLALGVGMLVDNAIVVLENIYRFREDGFSRKDAAVKGASEVAMAVTASTLTTVAVFLPIVFVEGITSTIFKELAMTVTLSLIASLMVSLTLIPMLSSKILKIDDKQKKRPKLFDVIYKGFDVIFKRIEIKYKKLLNWALSHRKSTVLISFLIFLISIASIRSIGAEFFPTTDEGQFTVYISLPDGAELDSTDEVVRKIEKKLSGIKEIETVFTTVGSGGNFSVTNNLSNKAVITGILVDLDKRSRSTSEVADQVREMVKDIPGAEIRVELTSYTMMGLGGDPISISIKGDDLDTLKKIGEDFKKIVASVEGTREVKTSLAKGIPEVQIRIDRYKASQYGLTAGQIASTVKSSISGVVASKYKYNGDEIDVVIKGEDVLRDSISNLKLVSIKTPLGISVPLSQVVDVNVDRGPVKIDREGQVRVVTVTSQIMGRDLRSISNDIKAKLDKYVMPPGYTYEIGGQNKELNESFADLGLALILAVVLVYMILASQFESLLHPFTIMLSVPLAFAGGALGLFITKRPLSVPGFIGVIILAGIVVNNAIVLVDYINTRRKNGEKRREAIVNAGPIRLRPIMMTTLTTVLGLIPLALGIGEGSELEAPLATVVIGGLLLSTFLTLVFIPVVYTLVDDAANRIRSYIKKRI